MANAIGIISNSCCSSLWVQLTNPKSKILRENCRVKFSPVSACATTTSDPYKTLRICHNASKSDVKRAFRQLALEYHPDVCRGNNNGVQFHQINEAYDIVMSQLRGESTKPAMETYESYEEETNEAEMEMNGLDLDLWEEWMGWEGAGIRDYSSHINPYI